MTELRTGVVRGCAGTGRLRVASPNIVNETFDDETVVVNLDSGSYFSLTRLASAVWVALPGATSDELVDEIAGRFGLEPHEVAPSVEDFIRRLRDEGLVTADGQAPEQRTPLPRLPEVFEPPRFEKFDDMADLLLLDPIHDVDATGWPTHR